MRTRFLVSTAALAGLLMVLLLQTCIERNQGRAAGYQVIAVVLIGIWTWDGVRQVRRGLLRSVAILAGGCFALFICTLLHALAAPQLTETGAIAVVFTGAGALGGAVCFVGMATHESDCTDVVAEGYLVG